MFKSAVYPGTFDPVTNGHIDLIERSHRLFDRVVIGIAVSESKNPLFTPEKRVELVRQATSHLTGIQVEWFDGLLVDYLADKGIHVAIRGLRATSDFEYELQMALANRQLSESFETIFMMPSQEYIFLSSRVVKAVASLGGDVSSWVPSVVYQALKEEYKINPILVKGASEEGVNQCTQ